MIKKVWGQKSRETVPFIALLPDLGLISLPADMEEYEPDTMCTVTGWGNTAEAGEPSDILQKVARCPP